MYERTNKQTDVDFFKYHPLKIDLEDGTHVRFRDLVCGARSALHHKKPIVDESDGRTISLAECVRLTA